MSLTIGTMKHVSRFDGGNLAYSHADLIHPTHGIVGSVSNLKYKPRWSFSLAGIREKHMAKIDTLSRGERWMIFDGASFDTKDAAAMEAGRRVEAFLEWLTNH